MNLVSQCGLEIQQRVTLSLLTLVWHPYFPPEQQIVARLDGFNSGTHDHTLKESVTKKETHTYTVVIPRFPPSPHHLTTSVASLPEALAVIMRPNFWALRVFSLWFLKSGCFYCLLLQKRRKYKKIKWVYCPTAKHVQAVKGFAVEYGRWHVHMESADVYFWNFSEVALWSPMWCRAIHERKMQDLNAVVPRISSNKCKKINKSEAQSWIADLFHEWIKTLLFWRFMVKMNLYKNVTLLSILPSN